jgi:hypothetical protein
MGRGIFRGIALMEGNMNVDVREQDLTGSG